MHLHRFVIGIQFNRITFRLPSVGGIVIDEILNSTISDNKLGKEYFTQVSTPTTKDNQYSISLINDDKQHNLSILHDQFIFKKTSGDSSNAAVNIDTAIEEFKNIWKTANNILSLPETRRIGFVGEYRLEAEKKDGAGIKLIDHLTNLPNVYQLRNDIEDKSDFCLIVFNIDNFQTINNFYGYMVGDYVIEEVGRYIKENITDHKVYRLSGDEFALFFTKKPSREEFIEIAEKLVAYVEKMIFFYENNELSIRVTIGGAYQIENFLEKADIDLKSEKKQQKSFLLYDEKLNIEEQYKDNIEWLKNLKIAIANDKIVPYFQAIYDNESDKIASYECLIRLIDEDENIVSPYKFLTIAK